MNTHVICYAAKSTNDPRGSIDGQLRNCREYAEGQGWQVVEEFSDVNASAFTGSRGNGLVQAKAQAAKLAGEKDGEVVLLVLQSDRLARGDAKQAMHLVEHFLDAIKAGYRVESVTENLGGEMGLVIASLYGERANADSRAKSVHTKQGKRRAAESGRRNGGPRPYGYQSQVVGHEGTKATTRLMIVPYEAQVVRFIYDSVEAGLSQSKIARELNQRGVATVRGCLFQQTQVSAILLNPLYAGFVRHYNDRFPAEHEAIIEWEQWVRVRRILSDKHGHGRQGGRPTKSNLLLSGRMLRCECGSALSPRSSEKKPVYRCSGRRDGRTDCTRPPLDAKRVDEAVWEFFEDWVLDVDAMVEDAEEARELHLVETKRALAEAEKEHATASVRLARVRRDYQDGKLDADDWKIQRAELTEELDASAAALQGIEQREQDLRSEVVTDTEREALETLAQIRRAVSRQVTEAPNLDAVRAALTVVFEKFQVHYDSSPSMIWGELWFGTEGGSVILEPVPRPEFVLHEGFVPWDQDGNVSDVALDEFGIPPQYKRIPISLRGKGLLSQSRR